MFRLIVNCLDITCEEEYAQAQRVASDMQAHFTARRELLRVLNMAEHEFEETEPTPEMDVSNKKDILMEDFNDCTITFDQNETMFGLNTSPYNFDNTQVQDTSTEVQVEQTEEVKEDPDFQMAHKEREAHQLC
jgi:hypothetical protein